RSLKNRQSFLSLNSENRKLKACDGLLSQKTTTRCRPVRSRPVIVALVLTGQGISFRESILTAYLSGAHTTLSGPATRRLPAGSGTGAIQMEPVASCKGNAEW